MCKAISWWLTFGPASLANPKAVANLTIGDKILSLFISEKTDSHHEIAVECGIKDGDGVQVGAGEIWPDPTAPSPDTKTWTLVWDAPTSPPKWIDTAGMLWLRGELETRAAAYVVVDGSHTVKYGRLFAFKTARVEARGSSSVVARDSSRVEARDSSRVVARDSSRVVARDSSRVVARDSSRVVARDSSRVEARDSSRVVARDSSRVEARDSSRVEARDSSRVVASSKYSIVAIRKAWDGTGYLPLHVDHNGDWATYTLDGDSVKRTAKA